MSNLDLLNTAKSQLLAAIVDATLNPKPTYSKGNQSVSWSEYLKGLNDQLGAINHLIVVEGGPFEVEVRNFG